MNVYQRVVLSLLMVFCYLCNARLPPETDLGFTLECLAIVYVSTVIDLLLDIKYHLAAWSERLSMTEADLVWWRDTLRPVVWLATLIAAVLFAADRYTSGDSPQGALRTWSTSLFSSSS